MNFIMKRWILALCGLCLFGGSARAQFSLGDFLNSSTVDKVVGALTNKDASLTVADLAGTWRYSAPGCKFESDDLLKSAGGEVVASSLKSKLATYYEKAGITSSRVSFSFADSTMVMTYGSAKLNGYVVKDEPSGKFVVTFTLIGGHIPVMVMDADITKSGNTMEILFDVEKLINVMVTIASKTQSSTLQSIGNLLSSYDGVLMGFELTKQ